MTPSKHPDTETLGRFVLGRLDGRAMAGIEAHLRVCPRCGEVAMQMPDDRLVMLLRAGNIGSATGSRPEVTAGIPRP